MITDVLPDDVASAPGLLADFQIIKAIKDHNLLIAYNDLRGRSNWEEIQVRHASFALTIADHKYKSLRFTDANRVQLIQEAPHGGVIVIPPGAIMLLYSSEIVRIPKDVSCRATVVGTIFSAGLVAEHTFADPGYDGRLGFTVVNVSPRTIPIACGEPLARLEFNRLAKPVHHPHPGEDEKKEDLKRTVLPQEDVDDSGEIDEILLRIKSFGPDERLDRRHVYGAKLFQSQIAQKLLQRVDRLTLGLYFAVFATLAACFGILALWSGRDVTTVWTKVARVLAAISVLVPVSLTAGVKRFRHVFLQVLIDLVRKKDSSPN